MSKAFFEPALALADVVDLFNEHNIRYFLVGSFASGFRGEFRATNDLDIVCAFVPDSSALFLEHAKRNFFCDEVAASMAIGENRSFNLIHENTFVKVDIFTRISDFEIEQFGLSSALRIPGTDLQANVSTAEYNIIAKLNWYLKSNRVLERQLFDVRSMIQINRETLDHPYLQKWAAHFQTTDLLNELLNEAI